MEFIVYVLISMSLNSEGVMNYYRPTTYPMESECEIIKTRMIDFMKSDSIIGSTSVCIKVIATPKKGKAI